MNAIKTTYRNVNFRSRLEAKWVAFFDSIGWSWTYEPFDLNGYIPDFSLGFYKPMIVEVKPVIEQDFEGAALKIDKSGWEHEAIIVGSALNEHSGNCGLGMMRESATDMEGVGKGWWWAPAILERCLECNKLSFYHDEASYRCRNSGCYDGDHFLNPIGVAEAQDIFAQAGNAVQWQPNQ